VVAHQLNCLQSRNTAWVGGAIPEQQLSVGSNPEMSGSISRIEAGYLSQVLFSFKR